MVSNQKVDNAAYAQCDKTLRLTEDTQEQTTNAVVQSIGVALLNPAIDQLQHNGESKKWDRVNNKIHKTGPIITGSILERL